MYKIMDSIPVQSDIVVSERSNSEFIQAVKIVQDANNKERLKNNIPTAMYDFSKKKAYLLYPSGKKVYV